MTRYVCDKQHDQYIKIVAIEEEIEVEAEVCEICFNEARHKSQMEAIKNSPRHRGKYDDF